MKRTDQSNGIDNNFNSRRILYWGILQLLSKIFVPSSRYISQWFAPLITQFHLLPVVNDIFGDFDFIFLLLSWCIIFSEPEIVLNWGDVCSEIGFRLSRSKVERKYYQMLISKEITEQYADVYHEDWTHREQTILWRLGLPVRTRAGLTPTKPLPQNRGGDFQSWCAQGRSQASVATQHNSESLEVVW